MSGVNLDGGVRLWVSSIGRSQIKNYKAPSEWKTTSIILSTSNACENDSLRNLWDPNSVTTCERKRALSEIKEKRPR